MQYSNTSGDQRAAATNLDLQWCRSGCRESRRCLHVSARQAHPLFGSATRSTYSHAFVRLLMIFWPRRTHDAVCATVRITRTSAPNPHDGLPFHTVTCLIRLCAMSEPDHIQRPAPRGYGDRTTPALPRDADILCIPAHPKISSAGNGFELRRMPTGEVVAIAFRSPERLVAQLGGYQPWVGLPAVAFSALVKAMGVGRVLIDPILDPESARWTADHVTEAIREVGM